MRNVFGLLLVLCIFMLFSCSFVEDVKEMFTITDKLNEELAKKFDTDCNVGWHLENDGVLTYQVYVKSPPDSMTVGQLTSQVKDVIDENTEKEYAGLSIIIGDMPPSDD